MSDLTDEAIRTQRRLDAVLARIRRTPTSAQWLLFAVAEGVAIVAVLAILIGSSR